MKPNRSSHRRPTRHVLALAVLALIAHAAHAAPITKAATGTDLTAGASWDGTAPGAGDIATWAANSLGAGLTLATDSEWQGINVAGMAADIDITGAGILTVGTSGIALDSVNLAVATPFGIGGTQSWSTTAGSTLSLAGLVSGNGFLTKTGSGTLLLSNPSNSFSGNMTVANGVVRLTKTGALGVSKTLTITSRTGQLALDGSGGAISLPAGFQFTTSNPSGAIRNIAGSNTISGAISMVATSGDTKIVSDGGVLTLAGDITSAADLTLDFGGTSTGANTVSGQLGTAFFPDVSKSDAGTWIFTALNPYPGSTTVNGGILQLSGTNGKLTSTSGISLNGGSLVLDNAAPNNNERIANGAPISINGGSLIYKGNNGANSSEIVAAITSKGNQFVTGNPAITLTYVGGRTITLTAASLIHTAGNAAILVNGLNLGITSSALARIKFTTAPTLAGITDALATGINSTSKATKIVPYLVGEATPTTGGDGTATGSANTMVTYQTEGGLRPLNPTDEFTQNAIAPSTNTRITSAFTATSGTINSLVIAGNNLTITDGNTVTVSSGAVLFASAHQIKASDTTGTLNLGAEGMLTVIPGLTGTLSAKVTGTAGLTKSGAGTLVLSNTNTYGGVTTLSGGVLELITGTSALPGGIGSTGGTSALTFNGGVLGLGQGNFTRSLAAAGTVTGATFSGPGGWAAYVADREVNLGGNGTPTNINTGTASTGFNGQTLILGAAGATHMVTFRNPITLAAPFTIQVDNGTAAIDATLSGIVSGAFPIIKTGAGTLALTALNTFGLATSATLVNAGTLLMNGNSSHANNGIIVHNGGTLGGTGTINGSVTVNSGGTLQPTVTGAAGILTLPHASSPAFLLGATLKIRAATATTLDKVALTNGAAVFSCSNLDLVIDNSSISGGLANQTIVTTTNGAGISGTFRSVSATKAGYAVLVTYNANSIIVNVVAAGPATHLVVAGFPSPQLAGVAGSVTVTARDAGGNTAAGYIGTVRFTSSDPAAGLPADYTFVTGDNGEHTFTDGVTLNTQGIQSITVTDTTTGSITGTQADITVTVPTYDFAAWAADPAQGLTAGLNDGPYDDPDFDGIANLLEFVLGGAPMVNAPEILPKLTQSGGVWLFEYDRYAQSTASTTQVVEYSTALNGWTEVTIPATSDGIVTITPGSPTDHVLVTLPALGTTGFARLKVSQ
jgi:autotransporter-associated beta strand protein